MREKDLQVMSDGIQWLPKENDVWYMPMDARLYYW